MAGIRSGLVAFDCGKCREAIQRDANGDPIEKESYIQQTLGCETPTQLPAIYFEANEEWYSCPMRWVIENQGVLDFIEKYDSYKTGFATPPNYEQQAAKFWEGVKVFESYLRKFTADKTGNNKGE